MKKLKIFFILSTLTSSFSVTALFGFGEDEKDTNKTTSKSKTAKECVIPAFAKAIGHEEKWLLHNGCPPKKDAKEQKNTSK